MIRNNIKNTMIICKRKSRILNRVWIFKSKNVIIYYYKIKNKRFKLIVYSRSKIHKILVAAKVRKRRLSKSKLKTSKAFKSTFNKKIKTSRVSNMKFRIYKISLRSFKIRINKMVELSKTFRITCLTTPQATKGCPSKTLWIPKPKATTWQNHHIIFLSKILVGGSRRQGIKSTTTPK